MICIIGLGKIGLPLAIQYAKKGYRVFGIDINPKVVNLVNSGVTPFFGEQILDLELKGLVNAELITAHLFEEEVIKDSKVIIVVVPLHVDDNGNPMFESIDSAVLKIGRELTMGTLVCFETTLPIGTTRNRFAPVIEDQSGFIAGKDFYVAFSPERVYSGRVLQDLGRYPKIVGGIDENSEIRAAKFYESVIDFEYRADLEKPNGVWRVGSSESAEFVKLAETTYRDVNIALANQFAILATRENLSIKRIIEGANSQPFSHIHNPGIAVGGHCIPFYPHLYLQSDPDAELIKVARSLNSSMPRIMIEKLLKEVGPITGLVCGVLGVSYRGGVKESVHSGVHPIVSLLTSHGAKVLVSDPLYTRLEIEEIGYAPIEDPKKVEVLVIQTDHKEYSKLSLTDYPNVKAILDGRGVLDQNRWPVEHFISIHGNTH